MIIMRIEKTQFINHNYNILNHNNGNHFYLWFTYPPQIIHIIYLLTISLYFTYNYVSE